jgi:hypothetical protein
LKDFKRTIVEKALYFFVCKWDEKGEQKKANLDNPRKNSHNQNDIQDMENTLANCFFAHNSCIAKGLKRGWKQTVIPNNASLLISFCH